MTEITDQLVLLPRYLGAHVVLSISALATGAGLTTLLTLAALRVPASRGPMLAVASIIQTVPSLALLALMVPLLGRIGFLPAYLALVAYSVLPMLRNSITGLLGVDADAIEAARGVGLTDGQILRRVRIPLAAPTIIAGIRTSAVWVVGIATLTTPVGATSLGNYIFAGLQTQRSGVVLLGCVSAAALALVIDGLIRLLESAARHRNRLSASIAVIGLAALFSVGSAPAILGMLRDVGRTHITVGAKTFTEQHVLAELIARRLRNTGLSADVLPSLGSTILFDALVNGRVDLAVDYTGTVWSNHMRRDDVRPADEVRDAVAQWLSETHRVTTIGTLGFENTYALALRTDRARRLGIKTIADLARRSNNLTIGGDYEFFGRPEWARLKEYYNLTFADQRSFDASLMYSAIDTGAVDVIAAFSTDGRIPALNLTVLHDPLAALPPYEAVLLASPHSAEYPRIIRVLAPLAGAVDADLMRRANMMVDVEGRSIADAARWLDEEIAARIDATIAP